jgi:hypothetical protein
MCTECRDFDRSIDLGVSGATERRQIRKDEAMRFMLLQNYGEVESDCAPMTEWTPADM